MRHQKRVAIVYDWLDKWGGVERVLLVLREIFPQAIFFGSIYDETRAWWAKGLPKELSFLQKFPSFIRNNRLLSLPFLPFAFESFSFKNFELVISVSSSFSKGIIVQPQTRHICYLLTPTRFLWTHLSDYMKKTNRLLMAYIEYLRKWDLVASQRPDKMIAISKTVRERCLKIYGRDAKVVYPPFDLDYWYKVGKKKSPPNFLKEFHQKFFLVVSRLEPYKRIDLAVRVFSDLRLPLIVVGQGTQANKLKKMTRGNIFFLSDLRDEELAYLYSRAEALIMPQEEDFGLVSLEAQFFSCPVIAYRKGGATETVIDKQTGIFFEDQNETALREAIERFNQLKYNLRKKQDTGKFLQRFDKKKFIKNFLASL
ncbi:MAG: glycosyltransferase [Patescibacteria group bacterium]|nr:glycosyltransferase [Patescibacteria group bacterium]